jgi:hypothetical protein
MEPTLPYYGGFETAFGLRWSTSNEVKINGTDYSENLKVKEHNEIIAPGFDLLLRSEHPEKNYAAMFRFRCLFFSKIVTELTASSSSIIMGTNTSNDYSDFDKAFFIDLSFGRTKKIQMNKYVNLLLDIGPSMNLTIVENENITERIFGGGLMTNGGFQFSFTVQS